MPDIVKFLKENYKHLDNLLGTFKKINVYDNYEDYYNAYKDVTDRFFVHEQKNTDLKAYEPDSKGKTLADIYSNPSGKVTGYYHYDENNNPIVAQTPEYQEFSKDGGLSKYLNFYDYLDQKGKSSRQDYISYFNRKYNVVPTVKSLAEDVSAYQNFDDSPNKDKQSEYMNRINQRIGKQNQIYEEFNAKMFNDLGGSGAYGKQLATMFSGKIAADKLPYFNYKPKKAYDKVYVVSGKLVKVNPATNETTVIGDFGENYGQNLNKSQLYKIDDKVMYFNTEHGLLETDIPVTEFDKMNERAAFPRFNSGFGNGNDKIPNNFYQDAMDWISYYDKNKAAQPELNNRINAWGNYLSTSMPFDNALVHWKQAGLDKYVGLNNYYKNK